MARAGKSFLLVPAGGRGEGMGHLTRCLGLARRLGGECAIYPRHLDEKAERFLSDRLRALPRGRTPSVVQSLGPADRWDIVLLDKRRTSLQELALYSRLGTVVCLDEGGEARKRAPYLIDTLPAISGGGPANISSPGFLDLPRRKKRAVPSAIGKILLSFGGEDPDGLTGKLLDRILSSRFVPQSSLAVVEGPFFAQRVWPDGLTVHRGIFRLSSILPEYDLLITHFGMTALEALALGVPVVLFNPSRYHARLGSLMGIPEMGVGRPRIGSLAALLANPRRLAEPVDRLEATLAGTRGAGLSQYLTRLSPGNGDSCPACAAGGNRVIGRFPERTYYSCGRCGTIYLQSFAAESRDYGRKYFTEEYRRQYGKTYLEDFPSLKVTGSKRIELMRARCGLEPPALVVDVGCAYGPFLSVLAEAGFQPLGVDVSGEAVRHVRDTLGIPAIRSSFEALDRRALPRAPIAGLTFWYVLEHFTDLHRVLRKASGLLSEGGALAFSTPNGRGLSALKGLSDFLDSSPADHYSVLSPRSLRRILAAHGFVLRHVRITGHHPERFPGLLGGKAARSALGHSLLMAASRLFRLGDTFEAYAVKGQGA